MRATLSTEQTLYFDQQGLLKRHDYDVEISGGTPAAHYVSDLKEFSGIVFPTKRRIFPRQPDGHSLPEPLLVSIDLDHFVLFNWTEGNPLLYLVHYVLSGEGDVAPVTREVLRKAEPNAQRRPAIHAGI